MVEFLNVWIDSTIQKFKNSTIELFKSSKWIQKHRFFIQNSPFWMNNHYFWIHFELLNHSKVQSKFKCTFWIIQTFKKKLLNDSKVHFERLNNSKVHFERLNNSKCTFWTFESFKSSRIQKFKSSKWHFECSKCHFELLNFWIFQFPMFILKSISFVVRYRNQPTFGLLCCFEYHSVSVQITPPSFFQVWMICQKSIFFFLPPNSNDWIVQFYMDASMGVHARPWTHMDCPLNVHGQEKVFFSFQKRDLILMDCQCTVHGH